MEDLVGAKPGDHTDLPRGGPTKITELVTTFTRRHEIIFSQLDDARQIPEPLPSYEEEAQISSCRLAQSMDALHQETVGDFRSAESRLSETETVSGGTKDSEEPQDSMTSVRDSSGPLRIPLEPEQPERPVSSS
ncbi:hypothetical protein Tco_0292031 [Tanacetum coccineum]